MSPFTWRSDLPALADRLPQAIDAGLVAAAEILTGLIAERLLEGYTSGAFVTGNVANSVTRTEPEALGAGRVIYVGTDVKYALYWEAGHVNLFTRKYERVEVWRPIAMESLPQLQEAFSTAFNEVFRGDGAVQGPLQSPPAIATTVSTGA